MAMNGSRKKTRNRREASENPFRGGSVAQALASSKNGETERAIVLLFFVLAIYSYAFYESVLSLPDVEGGRRIGDNLNLARLDPGGQTNRSKNLKLPRVELSGGEGSVGDESGVPIGHWPVTVRDEEGTYEKMIHPGDNETPMEVPKFWSKPLHNGKLFTRNMAMKVGTCVEPDPESGSHVRGDACPLHQRTIYIGIASYRDFQCRQTVESIFNRATHPERLRVGECQSGFRFLS